jgi:hypothetical protein
MRRVIRLRRYPRNCWRFARRTCCSLFVLSCVSAVHKAWIGNSRSVLVLCSSQGMKTLWFIAVYKSRHAASYILRNKERNEEIRSQHGKRKLDKQVPHLKGKTNCRNICKGCHEKRLQSNFYIPHRVTGFFFFFFYFFHRPVFSRVKTRRFGNWICFRLQVKRGEDPYSVGPLRKS